MSTKTEEGSYNFGPRGGEYELATERINSSLQKIRSELSEIRDQDLKLLKQLIHISETIKRMSEDRLSKRRTWYGQRQSICSESAELYLEIEPLTPDLDDYREAILVRQISGPVSFSRDDLQDMRTNLSVFDAPISLDSDTTMDQDWPPNCSRVQLRHRPHSVSILSSNRSYGMDSCQERTERNDKSYEEILQRNVRLWKGRKSVHISEDEEDGARTPVNNCSFFTDNDRRSPVSLQEDSNTKRNSDSGSSSSSVINSSGSSYSSSAINADSSRDSSSSCSSCVFSLGETMLSDVVDNSFGDFGNAVSENSHLNLLGVAKRLENNSSSNDSIGPYSEDFVDTEDHKDENDEQNLDDQTPVVEIRDQHENEWIQNDLREKRRDRETERRFETRVPNGKETSAIERISERLGRHIKEDTTISVSQLKEREEGVKDIYDKRTRNQEDMAAGVMEDKEFEREQELRGVVYMARGGSEIAQGDEAVGGRTLVGSQEEKEAHRERGKDEMRGEKPKRKESGGTSGAGVVRALLDHIGRKIENRVTVGMAEYSRSILPVISEMSKKDGRQKSSAHRPRELDIT